MKKQESLWDLVGEAKQMLLERPKPEQDLIYAIAKLDDQERTGIILAYQGLYNDQS
jgi:hypothetical protein